jgi:hypothetical protein
MIVLGVDAGCQLRGVGRWRGSWVTVGVNAGVHGFCGSDLVHCRVAAFQVFARYALAVFFITISHCAWQRVISLSKATKKRSKENAFTALP